MEDIIRGLHTIEPAELASLLLCIFIKHPLKAVQFWLVTSLEIGDMPSIMFMHATATCLLDSDLCNAKLAASVSFLWSRRVILEHYIPLITTVQQSAAMQQLLMTPRSKQQLTESYILGEFVESAESWIQSEVASFELMIGCVATSKSIDLLFTLVKDDLDRLKAIVTDPAFRCAPVHFEVTARRGSIKCFRFLTINWGFDGRDLLPFACEGGNSEIVQICIENGGIVSEQELYRSILGMQFEVTEWLIERQNINVDYLALFIAFSSGNWIVFKYLIDNCEPILTTSDAFAHILDALFRTKTRQSVLEFVKLVVGSMDPWSNVLHRNRMKYVLKYDDVELCDIVSSIGRNASLVELAADAPSSKVFQHLARTKRLDIPGVDGSVALKMAVLHREEDRVRNLLANGASIVILNWEWSLLCSAMHGSSAEIVELLLGYGASVNACGLEKVSPLMFATEYAEQYVKKLLNLGANVNWADADGVTALMYAIFNKSDHCISQLIAAGANVNSMNNINDSVLYYGVQSGDLKVVSLLVDHGADINSRGGKCTSLVTSAILRGAYDIVEFLLDHGANPNPIHECEEPPLLGAVELPNASLVSSLVQHGADPNYPLTGTMSILIWAIMGLEKYAARCMRDALAIEGLDNLPIVNSHVLMQLSKQDDRLSHIVQQIKSTTEDILTTLVSNGAAVNSRDGGGHTPLHYAVNACNPQLVSFLIAHGASVDSATNYGCTPLGRHISNIECALSIFFEKAGCECAIRGPLVIAYCATAFEIVKILIDNGANASSICENESSIIGIVRVLDDDIANSTKCDSALSHDDQILIHDVQTANNEIVQYAKELLKYHESTTRGDV